MITRSRLLLTVAASLLTAAVVRTPLVAQNSATPSFTLDQVLAFPFPDNLIAAPRNGTIAWTFNERGLRNIYTAEAPEFTPRRVTPYQNDDGQELTNLSFSADGKTVLYVRGGDHDANWPAEGNLMPDPSSSPIQPRMQVWAVAASGRSAPVLLGEGDEPVVAPTGDRVAFVHDRKIWIAAIDGSKPAEAAFFARGTSRSPVWSPDGRTLAFVSDRDDHSFIALYAGPSQPIRYLSPSTSRDSDPVWSPDGRQIAFVRQPGRGGALRPMLALQPQPWSIWVADVTDGASRQVWKSGDALVDSMPRIAAGVSLRWPVADRLVFTSYHDGWPHLYSIRAACGAQRADAPSAGVSGTACVAQRLTTGSFMVEYSSVTADGRFVVYNANTGPDRSDIDRRHVFKVPVDGSSAPIELTSGTAIEWNPVATGDGRTIAFLRSDARHSPLPAVMPMNGGEPRTLAADRVPSGFPAASQLVTPEPITFKASDGVEVHAQLFKSSAPGRRPALVYVHGGPPRQMLLGWHYMDYYANDYAANQYLASRGFIVLSVNYRLGIGYGHAFHFPEHAGARGASEYLDVIAGGKYLQSRADVDPKRVGIWGGSYGGYLTALALGRNSDVFAAGVDIHGVHDRVPAINPDQLAHAIVGDGITEGDYREMLKVAYESSPISSVATWKSPVLLIHGDDDRNVRFHETIDLKRRLLERGVSVEELVIPDDIHDFLLWRSWRAVTTAAGEFFERKFAPYAAASQP